MLKIIIGLILLLIPFLLIYKFKDKRIGFVYILSFLIGFNLLIAVFTQVLGVFNYLIVIGILLIIDFFMLLKIDYKKLIENFKKIKIDRMLIFIIIVILIMLYSVHYNYTGKVTTINENFKEVENMEYDYPYFSDEWSAVSLIQYSISSGKLPLVNPLWYNEFFPNLEFPFHSFASQIMLVLNLTPSTQYTLLSLFSGLLICILIYFILRVNRLGMLISGISALSVPYIVNGMNLPGILVFLPLTMGIICLLLSFIFISLKRDKMILFTSFLTLIFYPPLFVLSVVSFISYLIAEKKIKFIWKYFMISVLVSLILGGFAFFVFNSFNEFISHIFSKIFYQTFTKNAIPDFSIWKIIPIWILFFAGFGMIEIIRRKTWQRLWLISPIVVGLIYWILYSRVLWRFIIEYERIVFFTSILIILLFGFGLYYFIKYLKKINLIRRYWIVEIIIIIIFALFLIFSFSYTQRDNWQKLKLYSVGGSGVYSPSALANNYLHEDDLRLFENIKNKRFLSVPWKGTVIGVVTNNYPLDTKPATITNKKFIYEEFRILSCEDKLKIAVEFKIDYVYSHLINCEGFKLIGSSSEGLRLYEVIYEF